MSHVIMFVHARSGCYGASFPDFPGCTTVAATVDELIAKAPEVLVFHVSGLIEDGLDVPSPRSVDTILADPDAAADRDDAALVVPLAVELPGRVVRVNISVDEGALDVIDRAAATTGETRSGYLVRAALERANDGREFLGGRVRSRRRKRSH